MIPEHLKLQERRLERGMTQQEAVNEIYALAVARGDKPPGLDPVAMSRHENGVKHPCPYYVAMYCEIYKATPEQLGLAVPGESGHPDGVDRRKFLASTASFLVTLALPTPTRLGSSDIADLQDAVVHLRKMDQLHGAGAVYPLSVRTIQRLTSLVEHASYSDATGRALRELVGHTVHHAGWLSFDGDRQDDAQRWWLEAMKWAQLAESDSVSVRAMAAMSRQASEQRPREAIDLAQAAQRTAGRTTPRLASVLLGREALGHAGQGDTARALAALGRAREHTETRHDDDPAWLEFYGRADFAWHEHRVTLTLGDMEAAEAAARIALALNDPVSYPRNHALYLTDLANVLVQRREQDEAAAVAEQATVVTAGLDSPRVTRRLQAVTQSLAAA